MAEVIFTCEKLAQVKEEMLGLIQAHNDEVNQEHKGHALDPDWVQYQRIEDNRALRILAARSGGKLVGYFFAMVLPSLHFKKEILAVSDIFYLHPEYRRSMAGRRLLKEGEKMMRDAGGTLIYMATKTNSAANIVVNRLGYKPVDTILFKDFR